MRIGPLLGALVAVCLAPEARAQCSRAVDLANEGDRAAAINIDLAIRRYEAATVADPTNHRILWKLAMAYMKKESWADVAATCEKAEKLAPSFASYFYIHGYALVKMAEKGAADWSLALEPLMTASHLDPNYSDPHFDLATVYLHRDDEKNAIAQWTQAIRLKPSETEYYLPLADLYIRLRFLPEAEGVLKEAIRFLSGTSSPGAVFQVHTLYGEVRERQNDWSQAVSEFEAAKHACGACSEPGERIAFFNLGAAYLRINPPNKAAGASNLTSFEKLICKGAAAARYADECTQAEELLRTAGTP